MSTIPIKERLMDAAVYFDQLFATGLIRRHASVNCVFHTDRSPSLSLDLATGKYHCFGCGASGGDILDFQRALYPEQSFAEALLAVCSGGAVPRSRPLATESPKRSDRPRTDRTKLVQGPWSGAHGTTRDDEVASYLYGRGLKLPSLPSDIRTHYSLDYWELDGCECNVSIGKFPAMLAAIRNIDGEQVGLHKTYIRHGKKADVPVPRKIVTVREGALRGAAIRLFPVAESMAVSEGIETGLAIHELSGLPVWACISTYGLEQVVLPPIAQKIYIGFDKDKSGAGLNAATKLARRLEKEHRQVLMVEPPGGIPKGSKSLDWLDVLNRNHANDSTEFYARTIFSAS